MTTISIGGNDENGHYSVRCSCGFFWNGDAEITLAGKYEPTLPIAEAVAHHRLEHATQQLDVTFTATFRDWLATWWTRNASPYNRSSQLVARGSRR